MSGAPATIVVVPRERFSHSLETVDQIYAVTEPPFELVYVDGGSPRSVRVGLERRARRHGFRLLREQRYLCPNEARNLGLRHARTPYVAFLDNDALVTPGWLEKLVRCAERYQAWVVGPLYLVGPLARQTVHMTPGTVQIAERDGRRWFHIEHRNAWRHLPEVRGELRTGPCDLIEFHSVLIRTDVFERLGPFDEGLRSAFEEHDLCLTVRRLGGVICFEPDSVVSYVEPPPVRWSDMPYFLLRWSPEWFEESLARFCAKWDLDPADPGFASSRQYNRH